MAGPHGDTQWTKVFVGGLAWETSTEGLRASFEQFGPIQEAVVITDRLTGKSKGYGFVTFQDSESARRATAVPNPIIDGRRANCNLAFLGAKQNRPGPGFGWGAPPYGQPYGGEFAFGYGQGFPFQPAEGGFPASQGLSGFPQGWQGGYGYQQGYPQMQGGVGGAAFTNSGANFPPGSVPVPIAGQPQPFPTPGTTAGATGAPLPDRFGPPFSHPDGSNAAGGAHPPSQQP